MSRTTRRSPLSLQTVAIAGSLVAATFLGGCAKTTYVTPAPAAFTGGPSVSYPIEVDRRVRSMELPVMEQASRLTPAERSVILGFMEDFQTERDGVVQIYLPAGVANTPAAEAIGADIVDLMVARSIPEHRIAAFDYTYQGSGTAPIMLAYSELDAVVRPCGDWSRNMTDSAENRNYANFGCAVQHNIAAQVADPIDFVHPRQMSEVDVVRRSTVIEDYRGG